jgi:hypothetical protein
VEAEDVLAEGDGRRLDLRVVVEVVVLAFEAVVFEVIVVQIVVDVVFHRIPQMLEPTTGVEPV